MAKIGNENWIFTDEVRKILDSIIKEAETEQKPSDIADGTEV